MHRSIPGSLVSHSMHCYLLCSYCSSEGLASPLCALHSVVGGHSALRRTVCTRAECPGGNRALGQDVRGDILPSDTMPQGVCLLSQLITNHTGSPPPFSRTPVVYILWFKLVCTWGAIRGRKRGWSSPVRSRAREWSYYRLYKLDISVSNSKACITKELIETQKLTTSLKSWMH